MKSVLVGGPILGERGSSSTQHQQEGKYAIPSHKSFEPLITPLVGVHKTTRSTSSAATTSSSSSTVKPERFVLLPHGRFIQVLAYATGKVIANFVPPVLPSSSTKHKNSKNNTRKKNDININNNDNNDTTVAVTIESVCLATYPTKPHNVLLDIFDDENRPTDDDTGIKRKDDGNFVDHVILAGCSDGNLYEFSLLVLLPSLVQLQKKYAVSSTNSTNSSFGLAAPSYGPRRVFRVTQNGLSVTHLTAPACVSHAEYGILVYVIVETPTAASKEDTTQRNHSISSKKARFSASLLRLLLPPHFDDSIMMEGSKKDVINLCDSDDDCTRVRTIGTMHCKERRDKHGKICFSTAPFRLESVVRYRAQDMLSPTRSHEFFLQQNVFLVVARSTSIVVYCERLSDTGLNTDFADEKTGNFPPVSFGVASSNNPLCSMSVSVNKTDVACGFLEGDIVVKSNLLALVEEYHMALERYERQTDSVYTTAATTGGKGAAGGIRMPDHPSNSIIEARVHWHAHPVTTLCYDRNSPPSDPIFYSGGDESVLVTWQLSRGMHRPSDVLPRLAQRGIVHILCPHRVSEGVYNSNDSILVYCEDNTLQLFEAHNKGLLWKVRGLAARRGNLHQDSYGGPLIACDPRFSTTPSSQLMLNGLPDAPGMLQWYDTRQQRVVGDLEIAPYNRVSSMERKDKTPMPAPSVTHIAVSMTGGDLMTVDIVSTENRFVGAVEKMTNGHGDDEFGCVTTVKFWVWNSTSGARSKGREARKPYVIVAAMAHPHGTGNKVAAIALSPNGQHACTVSNDEQAFRLWQKVAMTSDDGGHSENHDAGGRRLPVWVCQYKISTPSGYSNHLTAKHAVAFSPDSSVLAICYRHMITIWDRHNTTLLTRLDHLNGDEAIESIEFIKYDMILCKSPSGVSLQSPFGSRDMGWSWSGAGLPDPTTVSCTQWLASHDVVAIAVYDKASDITRIVFVDVVTGEPVKGRGGVSVEEVAGMVCSIGQLGVARKQSNWSDGTGATNNMETAAPLTFDVLTSEGLLIEWREDSDKHKISVEAQSMSSTSESNVPRLPSNQVSTSEPARKRRRVGATTYLGQSRVPDRKLSLANFGSMLEDDGNAVPLLTSELPSLSGEFARTFVGRNLLRRRESDSA